MHTLPDFHYAYDALEPYIDTQTMRIHHTKHHQAYIDKLNAALKKYPELKEKSADDLIRELNSVPQDIRTAVRNHGGGHANHSFFWTILKKNVPVKGKIAEAITAQFGDFDKFKHEFTTAAAGQFGSGWTWLVVDNNNLEIMTTANQDSPLTLDKTPIMGVDVWEHAYYLKYQNRRPDYLEAFFNIINWEKVNELYLTAK